MVAKATAAVPRTAAKARLSVFREAMAPIRVMPEMALDPDINGVCSVEGTLEISSKPKKIDKIKKIIAIIITIKTPLWVFINPVKTKPNCLPNNPAKQRLKHKNIKIILSKKQLNRERDIFAGHLCFSPPARRPFMFFSASPQAVYVFLRQPAGRRPALAKYMIGKLLRV